MQEVSWIYFSGNGVVAMFVSNFQVLVVSRSSWGSGGGKIELGGVPFGVSQAQRAGAIILLIEWKFYSATMFFS